MDKFFRERDKINIPKERGDRLRISSTDGKPYNLVKSGEVYSLNIDAVKRIKKFIEILSGFTGWNFKEDNWLWSNLILYNFTKDDFESNKKRINNATFQELMSKNPLSWAMTSGANIEYTLEEPDKLP